MKNHISVCIPTYNGQKYIQECINSVLAQTYKNYEIIVVDDCSSDSTFEIIKDYAFNQSKIHYFRNDHNLGLALNWNQCVKYAQGEWIKFIFQDDIITENCLEQFIAATKLNVPIICCGREFIFDINTPHCLVTQYKNRLFLKELFPGKNFISPNELNGKILKYPGENFIGEPTAIMLHKSVFKQFGLFLPSLIHFCDFEYWLRVACHTGIAIIPDVLAYFRVHNQSASAYNQKNYYRSFRIDQAILFYNFAFVDNYYPLQAYSNTYFFVDPIMTLLSIKARRARLDAYKPNDNHNITEWRNLLAQHPEIEKLSQRSFVSLMLEYLFFKTQFIMKSNNADK